MFLDPHQPNAWLIYVGSMLLYTVLAFGLSFKPMKILVFSKRNSKPASVVLKIHFQFLIMLFLLMLLVYEVYPYLPHVLLGAVYYGRNGTPISSIRLLFLAAVWALGVFERGFIFEESGADDSVA